MSFRVANQAAGATPSTLTDLTVTNNLTLSGGTANGVLYLNASKVATSGSALVFDGSNLGIGTSSPTRKLSVVGSAVSTYININSGDNTSLTGVLFGGTSAPSNGQIVYDNTGNSMRFLTSGAEYMRLDSSGNLGIGTTPSAWNAGYRALEFASGAALWAENGSNSNIWLSSNATLNSGGSFIYKTTAAAAAYNSQTGIHRWFTAPSGTAGNAISFTQALTLDANRNLALNTTSVGTSAVGALSIGSGTEPSSGPADTVQLYSVDRSAGNTIPAFYCEGTGVTDAGITNTTVTHKIAMKINGTVYYLLATTNAT